MDKTTAHALLDLFAASGGLLVDTASNYPINRNPAHFGLAQAWLGEWIAANPGAGVKVWLKLGGADNTGGGEAQLSPSYLRIARDLARARFGDALGCLAVHWDNREDMGAIGETVAVFEDFADEGLDVGFSGLAAPAIYATASPQLRPLWRIQVKENLLTRRARDTCHGYFPDAAYYAYGLNMGGLKLRSEEGADTSSRRLRNVAEPGELDAVRAFVASDHGLSVSLVDLNQLAILAAATTPALRGVIIGPSSEAQLRATLDVWRSASTLSDQDAAILSQLDFRGRA